MGKKPKPQKGFGPSFPAHSVKYLSSGESTSVIRSDKRESFNTSSDCNNWVQSITSVSIVQDACENGSCGYPSEQEDYEQTEVCRAGGVGDKGSIGTHTGSDNNLCKPPSRATINGIELVDDLCSPPNKPTSNGHELADDIYSPPANPQMDALENESRGYASKQKDCEQNGVTKRGGAGDDCTDRGHIGNDNDLCNTLSKLAIGHKLVDDLYKPPANHMMDADENESCGYTSKQENCKQNKAAKPGRGGDDHSGGTQSSNSNGHNLCNAASKPAIHGYTYKLVDDFIFSDRSLIGRFTRLRPSIQELSQWSNINWSSKLRSIWMFKMIGHGFFKIEFFDQEDCEFVLENGPWFMGVAGLSLLRWSPDFDSQNPGPLKTPVWMSLLDLPLEFWNEGSLIKICSKVGKVLHIANSTSEMNGGTAARVCVEVDLKEGLMASIDLHCSGASLTQDLDYEGIPFRCKICRSADHLDGSCPRKSTKNVRKKK